MKKKERKTPPLLVPSFLCGAIHARPLLLPIPIPMTKNAMIGQNSIPNTNKPRTPYSVSHTPFFITFLHFTSSSNSVSRPRSKRKSPRDSLIQPHRRIRRRGRRHIVRRVLDDRRDDDAFHRFCAA